MDIENQFNLIAKEYDSKRRAFIPCFDDFYEGSTEFVALNMKEPQRILDLGAGTGLLTAYWYKHFPDSCYVLADIAEEMLNIAKKRFDGLTNISYEVLDYSQGLPDDDFDVIISALSVHHLDDEQKAALFSRIYQKLPEGGMFVNYDQFCADNQQMRSLFDSHWESYLYRGELTENDIALWKERRRLDKECSAEKEIEMLKSYGFTTAERIYTYMKFSVIVCLK